MKLGEALALGPLSVVVIDNYTEVSSILGSLMFTKLAIYMYKGVGPTWFDAVCIDYRKK